jgi:hypothetical protein
MKKQITLAAATALALISLNAMAREGRKISPYITVSGGMNLNTVKPVDGPQSQQATNSPLSLQSPSCKAMGAEAGIRIRLPHNMVLGFAVQSAFSNHYINVTADMAAAGWSNTVPVTHRLSFKQRDIGFSIFHGMVFPIKKNGLEVRYGFDAFISMQNSADYSMAYRDVWDEETQASFSSPAMFTSYTSGDARATEDNATRTFMPYYRALPFLAATWNMPVGAGSQKLMFGFKFAPASLEMDASNPIRVTVFAPDKEVIQKTFVTQHTMAFQLSVGVSL